MSANIDTSLSIIKNLFEILQKQKSKMKYSCVFCSDDKLKELF